jgi:hypothetical protein
MFWEWSKFGTSDISTERVLFLGMANKIQNLALSTILFSCYTYQQTIAVDW